MAVGCPALSICGFDFGRPSVPPLRRTRKRSLLFVGAGHWPARGRTVCAPTKRKKRCAVNVLWEGESPRRFAPPLFDKGDFSRRGTTGRLRSRLSKRAPSSAPFGGTFPLEGGRLTGGSGTRPYERTRAFRDIGRGRSQTGPRAAARAAPTDENGPGALARQRQARLWNRACPNFSQTQGPVARRGFRHSLRFCAPEIL